MKVLYMLSNYPQASESYIEAEIAYARLRGVVVAVWSEVVGYGEELPGVRVYRNHDPHEAVDDFQPDLLHVHYLVMAEQLFRSFYYDFLPVTVRAHSFDWAVDRAKRVSEAANVRAIYAFPHFARQADHVRKIAPLPVAYDAALYDVPSAIPVAHDRIVRLSAGRRMKGLEDFFAVCQRISPRGSFRMAASRIVGDEKFIEELVTASARSGVGVFVDLPRGEAVKLTRSSGIYLDTSDPAGHPFGMPVSIAEALASGAVVLVRDCPAAREYGGEAAYYYRTVEEAAILVDQALRLGIHEREMIGLAARERAKLFRNDAVLPQLVDDWEQFAAGGSQ